MKINLYEFAICGSNLLEKTLTEDELKKAISRFKFQLDEDEVLLELRANSEGVGAYVSKLGETKENADCKLSVDADGNIYTYKGPVITTEIHYTYHDKLIERFTKKDYDTIYNIAEDLFDDDEAEFCKPHTLLNDIEPIPTKVDFNGTDYDAVDIGYTNDDGIYQLIYTIIGDECVII